MIHSPEDEGHGIEVERYELSHGLAYQFELTRREFCRFLGGGVLVLLAFPAVSQNRQSGRPGNVARDGGFPEEIGAWIQIREDGTVRAATGKVEVGQGIRTSLAQAVAEELRIALDQVEMVMGDTLIAPYDRGTFGSQTTPNMSPQLRRAAVAAREALLDIAAGEWGVERGKLRMERGRILEQEGTRSVSFGELAKGRTLTRTIQTDAVLTPPSDWIVAGKPALNVNGRAIVTGTHKYPADLGEEGLLHGRVLRPPFYEAKLLKVDISGAERMAETRVVRDGDFIGVAASDPATAARAMELISAEWSKPEDVNHETVYNFVKANPAETREWRGGGGNTAGDVSAAFEKAAHTLEATYTAAYIAHVPLETRAACAEWKGDELFVAVGTQRPFGVRTELAQAFSIPEERIHVRMPDTGSAYGGKHTGEVALEAARLAKATGKPVKVVWTREEEFRHAYFRPVARIEVRSGVDAEGNLTAWEFHNWNSGGSGIRTPYEVPNQKIEFHSTRYPLRQGSYRALAATANHFARETHMDELAALAKLDPLEFRLRNLKDERLRAVLEAAAEAFGWQTQSENGRGEGHGIACGTEKGGFVATCVQVDVRSEIRVVRAVTAFECGAVINPNGLKNQVEGCVIQGLGGALFEEIEFAKQQVRNASLGEYRVPRFRDMPQMTTVLVDRKDLPSAGAGECPIVAIAPAIANAVYSATGQRLRAMPLNKALAAANSPQGAKPAT